MLDQACVISGTIQHLDICRFETMKLKQLTTEVSEGHRPPQSMLSLSESSTSTRAACTVLPVLKISMNNYFDHLKTLICSSDDLVLTCEVHACV